MTKAPVLAALFAFAPMIFSLQSFAGDPTKATKEEVAQCEECAKKSADKKDCGCSQEGKECGCDHKKDSQAHTSHSSMDMNRDNKNCGKHGNACASSEYCFKGECIDTPVETKFCYTEYCMATCNDGFVIRDLCSPCTKSCNSLCEDHGGCKDTCSHANGNTFNAKCNPHPKS